jgi:hypothetical protein
MRDGGGFRYIPPRFEGLSYMTQSWSYRIQILQLHFGYWFEVVSAIPRRKDWGGRVYRRCASGIVRNRFENGHSHSRILYGVLVDWKLLLLAPEIRLPERIVLPS